MSKEIGGKLMGKTLIGKMIAYWIFLLGGVFVARVVLQITAPTAYIVLFVLMTIVYWAFALYNDRKRG